MKPLLDAPAAVPSLGDLPTGPRPGLADALRRSLVPSSVDELNRQGFREVKVLPREAVEHMVAEAAARLVEDRWEIALETERVRIAESARAEAAVLSEALEAARRTLREEREERQALERWRENAVRRLAEIEGRARAAEEKLAEARAGFEAQVATVLANPFAFGNVSTERRRRKKARAVARGRVKAAVKRLVRENRELRSRLEAPAPPPALRQGSGQAEPCPAPLAEPERPAAEAVERIAKRSFGFGNPRAIESRVVTPPDPEPATAAPAPARHLHSRLEAIEAKLDALLEKGLAAAGAEDGGVASRFRDGRRAGLESSDPQVREKRSILAKLRDENVKLRKELIH